MIAGRRTRPSGPGRRDDMPRRQRQLLDRAWLPGGFGPRLGVAVLVATLMLLTVGVSSDRSSGSPTAPSPTATAVRSLDGEGEILIVLKETLTCTEAGAMAKSAALVVTGFTVGFVPPSGITQRGGYRLDAGETLTAALETYSSLLEANLVEAIADAEAQAAQATDSETTRSLERLLTDLQARLESLTSRGIVIDGLLVNGSAESVTRSVAGDARVAEVKQIGTLPSEYEPPV